MAAGESTNPVRQRMINMMYLVLTALLALNVSADILKAFALVNGGLEKTNGDYLAKNNLTMKHFAKAYENDKLRAQRLYDNARQANTIADAMYNDLQALKEMMAEKADGWVPGSNKTAVEDDQDLEIAENYFVSQDKGKNGRELREKLENFEKRMKGLLINREGVKMPQAANFSMDTETEKRDKKEGAKKEWHEYYFGGVPVIAAITEITKFQNDVRNAQSEVSNYLFNQIGAEIAPLDSIEAIVRSNTPAVYMGQEYVAEIFLGASSTTQEFTATVDGQPVPVENGRAIFKTSASGAGEKTLKVAVQYRNGRGEMETKTADINYQVFTGQAVISADEMNMLYRGLENPISVSVPGFSDAQVIIDWGGLTAVRTGVGKYKVRPTGTTPKLTVSVSVRMPNGTIRNMGNQVYRVRNLPRPEVLLGGKPGGTISKPEIEVAGKINAGLGQEFPYQGLQYEVTGYTIALSRKGQLLFQDAVSNNRISETAKTQLRALRPGDMISIGNVNVKGPSGTLNIGGTTYTVRQ